MSKEILVTIKNSRVIPSAKLQKMRDTLISIAEEVEDKLALPKDQYLVWVAKAKHVVDSSLWTEKNPWFGNSRVVKSYVRNYYLRIFVILYRVKKSRSLKIKYLKDQVVITPDGLLYEYAYLDDVISQKYSREKIVDFIVTEFRKPYAVKYSYENGIYWMRPIE